MNGLRPAAFRSLPARLCQLCWPGACTSALFALALGYTRARAGSTRTCCAATLSSVDRAAAGTAIFVSVLGASARCEIAGPKFDGPGSHTNQSATLVLNKHDVYLGARGELKKSKSQYLAKELNKWFPACQVGSGLQVSHIALHRARWSTQLPGRRGWDRPPWAPWICPSHCGKKWDSTCFWNAGSLP